MKVTIGKILQLQESVECDVGSPIWIMDGKVTAGL